jgi:hypothetical protein
MFVTAAGVGAGVGLGCGSTVNVHVASWRATATALPASAAESKTTVGQANVAPLTHAGMSRMTRNASSPLVRAARSFAARPIPTGSSANGERAPNSRSRAVVFAVSEQDHRRPDRVERQVLCRLFHRRDIVRVDADALGERWSEPLPVRGAERSEAVGEVGDGRRTAQEFQVRAALVPGGLRCELDESHRGITRDEVRGRLVDAIRHPLEGRGESVAVRLVLEDRCRIVEDDHDVRAVRGLGHGARHQATRDRRDGDREGGGD